MRTRMFFLIFPAAIFLMVLAGILAALFTGIGKPEPGGSPPGYVIAVDRLNPVWPLFEVTEGGSTSPDAEYRIEMPALGEISISRTDRFGDEAGEIDVAYEANVDLQTAGALKRWLDHESMMQRALTPADREWLAKALGAESGGDAELLAGSFSAGDESADLKVLTVEDVENRIRIDLQMIVRLAIREVLYIHGLEVSAEDLETLFQRHIPEGLIEINVFGVESVNESGPA